MAGVTAPDDPYASPPRDREGAGTSRGPGPQPPFGQAPGPPTGLPSDGPPPPAGAGGLGTAALVAGALALVLGVTIVGGVLLGTLAVMLGARARARARAGAHGGGAGTALAGIVLGTLGLAVAGGMWLYVQDDLADYQGCKKASVSFAQDRECEQQLRRGIEGR